MQSKRLGSQQLHFSDLHQCPVCTTMATHVAHIYRKPNVQNAPAAVTKAFQTGILPARKGKK
ncbi:MAG: hypothetical protein K9N55_00260 [Phycisphaerae bacterium]|nr:hypothetical protein [Phycisphaerae bacterium]